MRKMMMLLPLMVLAAGIMITACSKSNEADLSQTGSGTDTTGTGSGGSNTCDTVNMTYTGDVLPVIQANCYSCHSNTASGGVSLNSYTRLKAQVDNGYLTGVITHASGYVPMPYNGAKLSDCDINKIKDWIARGAQNN